MYPQSTVESLQAYADRLHQQAARFPAGAGRSRTTVRSLVRRVRRSS